MTRFMKVNSDPWDTVLAVASLLRPRRKPEHKAFSEKVNSSLYIDIAIGIAREREN